VQDLARPCGDDLSRTSLGSTSSHRALNIAELLDRILTYAGPDCHLITAWSVSRAWRRFAVALVASRAEGSFRQSGGEPVDYGDPMSADHAALCAPTTKDLEDFGSTLRSNLARISRVPGEPGTKYCYFPGNLTQQPSLPDDLCATLNDMENLQHHTLMQTEFGFGQQQTHSSRDSDDIYWLDWSQFDINPHFQSLFGRRVRQQRGRLEIDLRRSPSTASSSLIFDHTLYPPCLLELLGPMFVTRPPCKTIGI
jgi:hypothetical protein